MATWQMVIGMNTFRPTDGVNDQIAAGERFTGSPGLGTHFGLGRIRTKERVDRGGVTAAFYRAGACSGERLRPNFNWSVLRAIGGYK